MENQHQTENIIILLSKSLKKIIKNYNRNNQEFLLYANYLFFMVVKHIHIYKSVSSISDSLSELSGDCDSNNCLAVGENNCTLLVR